ncbi:MAG TPA: molybdate ABC transporter substrate-binding protein [Gallionella sp.]|nr:molybdate ABC transporter substrate-binding protein [Gallionella sp.]
MINKNRAMQWAGLLLGTFLAMTGRAEEQLVVSAASSLKDAFVEIGKVFEGEHPGKKISFNFAGSNQLANQIEQGAPVDVFASADMAYIQRLANKNLTGDAAVLAKNKMVLIVSKSAKVKIDALPDLANKGVRLIVPAKQVPAAIYARQVLAKAEQSGAYGAGFSSRVLANAVSEEPDVRMAVMKIAMGEGDAGIVYASDVAGDVRSKVRVIALPEQFNAVAEYGAATVRNSAHAETAKAFYAFLQSSRAESILVKSGLLPAQSK